ncbi:unnamed protein product [Agarophyton chilense]
MVEKSASVPFLPKPANIPDDAPGYAGFDPIGFSNMFNFKFLQEAEIKHSRICMLAVLGLLVSEFYTFPWYSDAPRLASAVHSWGVQQGCLNQLLVWTSFWEIVVGTPAVIQMISLGSPRRPGEFAFDPLGLGNTAAAFKKFQTAELVNGRLAMIAIGGLLHQEFLTGMTPVQQLLSGNVLP